MRVAVSRICGSVQDGCAVRSVGAQRANAARRRSAVEARAGRVMERRDITISAVVCTYRDCRYTLRKNFATSPGGRSPQFAG
jgi:hypothetical protein